MRWRVQVERAARILYWSLIARAVLFVGGFFHPPAILRLAELAVIGITVWTCWLLSVERPVSETIRTVRLRRWLRGAAITTLAVGVTGHLVAHTRPSALAVAFDLPFIALCALGLLYVRSLFRQFDDETGARRATVLARRYVVRALLANVLIFVTLRAFPSGRIDTFSDVFSAGLGFGLLGVGIGLLKVLFDAIRLAGRLRSTLAITEHEWWTEPGTGWASLAVSGAQGRAEVVEATGTRKLFSTKHEAQDWLASSGYVDAASAVADGLALSAPPVIALRTKQRLRVAPDVAPLNPGADPSEVPALEAEEAAGSGPHSEAPERVRARVERR